MKWLRPDGFWCREIALLDIPRRILQQMNIDRCIEILRRAVILPKDASRVIRRYV
jgi:hypothetical protein